MADNYLESRYEEVFGSGARKSVIKRTNPSLNTLLVKNRTIRRFRQDIDINAEQLRTIVNVNSSLASAMNRQLLRFRPVDSSDIDKVNALRQILFREPAREESARAFIIVYSILPEERYIDIDLGISLQSMALKAVELGLNSLIKGNLDRDALRAFFKEDDERIIAENGYDVLEPVAVLCVGKSAESVFLKPVNDVEDLMPYTKEGVHYVPKLQSETLTLK